MTSSRDPAYHSYEKIAESEQGWRLDDAGYRLLQKSSWVVTEKIHGANFCMICDGQSVRGASRRQLLGPGDSFFGYQELLRRLEQTVLEVFALVRQQLPQLAAISIYGELFGGEYPHPAVPRQAGVQAVQSGVYYAPGIEFCAFDLGVAQRPEIQQSSYLDYAQASAIFQQAGLLYAPPLLIGSYHQALSYPLGFDSGIPRLLGLPALAEPNRAEGVVIKPLKSLLVPTPAGLIRPILKRKIAEFNEDRRFHQAEKWAEPSLAASTALDLLSWEVYNLATEARLANAISKLGYAGPRGPSRARQLFRLLSAEIRQAVEESQQPLLARLSQAERAQLWAQLDGEVRRLIQQHQRRDGRRI